MKTLILASHGDFSVELKKSLEMIMGPQENILTVTLQPDEGEVLFTEKVNHVTKGLEDYIVFADLMGGTPCNIFGKKLMEEKNFHLYAGMNLPMIIAYLNGEMIGEDTDLVNAGKDSIVSVNQMLGINR